MALKYSPGLLSQLANFGQDLTSEQARSGRGILPGPGGMAGAIRDATRAVGSGLFGLDMRTPDEKILAATAGIDRTTPEGQLAAIEARLKFETDIDKRNTLGQQAAQLRRQIASDARQAAADQLAADKAEDLKKLNARAEPILRQAGYTELADMAKTGSLTQAQITSTLSNINKDKIALEKNRGDLAAVILSTPELEGTEEFKSAQQGTLPDIAPRFQPEYLAGLREEAQKGQFIKTVKARKGGEKIAKDLEEGLTTFAEAQRQAADLGDVTYGDVKFYKVGEQILPTRERKQQDGTKDVVTWSALLNKYVEVDETRLEEVPPDRDKTPKVVKAVTKKQAAEVKNAFEFEENTTDKPGKPFSNQEKLEEFDDTTKNRVLRDIGDRAAQLTAQNPGTPFSQHIQPAIEEIMSRVEFTDSVFGDTVEYRPATATSETEWRDLEN